MPTLSEIIRARLAGATAPATAPAANPFVAPPQPEYTPPAPVVEAPRWEVTVTCTAQVDNAPITEADLREATNLFVKVVEKVTGATEARGLGHEIRDFGTTAVFNVGLNGGRYDQISMPNTGYALIAGELYDAVISVEDHRPAPAYDDYDYADEYEEDDYPDW